MKKNWILLAVIFAQMLIATNAQGQMQIFVNGGSSHFLGDIGGKPSLGTHDIQDLNLRSTGYFAGAGIKFSLSDYFALRMGGYYGKISADDKYTTNPERRNRNLNFFSNILGGNAMVELAIPINQAPSNWYVFGGLEYFHFDPKTTLNGQTVRLQPLGTEGQNFLPGKSPYKLNSFAIPFGVGYTFYEGPFSKWGVELNMRKTFTDYIDDVSTQYVDKTLLLANSGQTAVDLSDRNLGDIPNFSDPGTIRGHSNHNDNFFFMCISYSFKLGASKPSNASFYSQRSKAKRPVRGRRNSGDGF